MNPIVWQPTEQRISSANITRFMSMLGSKYRVSLNDYPSLYQWSIENRSCFWEAVWRFTEIVAETMGETVLIDDGSMIEARWFPEARLNYAENLLKNRHGDKVAIVYGGEDGNYRQLSYQELYASVSKLVQALRDDGVVAGDRVVAVMPNIPETLVAMLAVTSVGAVWASCSPDFGGRAIIDRFAQIEPKVLFFVDGYQFNGKRFDCRERIDSVLQAIPSLKVHILVDGPRTTHNDTETTLSRYTQTYSGAKTICFEQLPFNHPLFILFSSGTTGVPKCIVHSVGGTLLQHVKEHQLHADVHSGDRLFYYTTCGWMMWNWLVSSLASDAVLVLYDGSAIYPTASRLIDLIDENSINIFGVSAKYFDTVRKASIFPKRSHRLSTLDTVLSTGSPLAPESFDYVYQEFKSDLCLSSISGGTDIVSCFVLGCPILPVRRGEIQCRGLGMRVEVFNLAGESVTTEKGDLVCTSAFPSMPVGFWNDPDSSRYRKAYFDKFPGVWCHGDYAELCPDGGMVIYGRSDSTLNPGGVRIGTAEIYRQVEQLDEIVDSVVIGQQWEGDCRVVLFVCLRPSLQLSSTLIEKIKAQIRNNASPRHVPAKVLQVTDVPRTKSGKIAEKAVRDVVHGIQVENIDALANPQVLKQFANLEELAGTSADRVR